MSFHAYTINELYSNADGSIQYIEMSVGNEDGEGFWAGRTLSVTQGSATHSFTFPTNLPSDATANTKVLIATQGFANLGVVSPDFIVPAGFLFTNGGTVNYAGVDSFSYATLPSNGTSSLGRSGSVAPASPTDFAGMTGTLSAGSGSNSALQGGSGNDTIQSRVGNDSIDGGAGIDTVVFSGTRSVYTVTKSATGYTVKDNAGSDGTDTLSNVERLQFSDTKIALDLDGNAGITAKILGAVFGKESVANKAYAGIGLSLLDGGTSYQDLMLLALNAKLGAGFSNADEVNLLYKNLVGFLPGIDDLQHYVETIATGQFTQTSLAIMAADLSLNATNINLVGLQQTGLEYS